MSAPGAQITNARMLPHPPHDVYYLFQILLGIELGDVDGPVAEDHPGDFHPELVRQAGRGVVPQLVRVPAVHAGPVTAAVDRGPVGVPGVAVPRGFSTA